MTPTVGKTIKEAALLLHSTVADRAIKSRQYLRVFFMNNQQLQRAFLQAGFKYLKVEMEAQVNPIDYPASESCPNCDNGWNNCADCDGEGRLLEECENCAGSGLLNNDSTCENCSGDGELNRTCTTCSGDGNVLCRYCDEGTVRCDLDEYFEAFESRFRQKLNGQAKHFRYLRAYHDGSVDTEITLTLRVDYLGLLPDIMQAFKQTCLVFGDCKTDNAGLHLTLLEGYMYPRRRKLKQRKLANYKREIAKLLLGLAYLGSNGKTRSFTHRDLRISANKKFSAICTHGDTCLEFRLFDTCYDEPKRVLTYLALMAKTLRYYTVERKKAVGIEKALTLDTCEKILNKAYYSKSLKLMDVYQSRESRLRLFDELYYLVNDKGRQVLTDLKQLNPSAMCPELFSLAKQYL